MDRDPRPTHHPECAGRAVDRDDQADSGDQFSGDQFSGDQFWGDHHAPRVADHFVVDRNVIHQCAVCLIAACPNAAYRTVVCPNAAYRTVVCPNAAYRTVVCPNAAYLSAACPTAAYPNAAYRMKAHDVRLRQSDLHWVFLPWAGCHQVDSLGARTQDANRASPYRGYLARSCALRSLTLIVEVEK